MGVPTPPGPPEFGNNCIVGQNGTPPLWAVDETPKYIYASFTGIELCPGKSWPAFGSLNGRTIKLTQDNVGACTFNRIIGDASFHLNYQSNGNFVSWLSVVDPHGKYWFKDAITSDYKCHTNFVNELPICFWGENAKNGFAFVWWSPGPRKIANEYNFMQHVNTMSELFPIDERFQVIKLCNVPMKSNVKVLYDTEYDPYQNELENFPTPWPNFQDNE